jgi:cation/acetate symporter
MAQGKSVFTQNLGKIYGLYTGVFIAFVVVLGIAEQLGLQAKYIGWTFMGVTIGVYALIGILSRTTKISQYYIAGRQVPAVYNGMATGSDWMSAASFISMAGALYALGYDGLAYIMGWTGGYVLLAVFLAPYLRKFGQFTIPDFLGMRYEGNFARNAGILAAIITSFTYLIAQVTGVGIITSRFLGISFEVGVFVGLGGILVCSVLGGMRAVTWTQVAQYIILIIAYLVPVTVLSVKETGVPIPQLMYGQVLQKIDVKEKEIIASPKEQEVRDIHKKRAADLDAKIKALPASLDEERKKLQDKLAALPADVPAKDREAIEKDIKALPKSVEEAKEKWTDAKKKAEAASKAPKPYTQPFARMDMKNMLILTLCLMVGTAGLPHILMRFYTTPSVKQARSSVGWALFFIFLLYFTAPAYAAFARNEILTNVVGQPIALLPGWVESWGKVGLFSVKDLNGDGILQFAEITLHTDLIVLATPEIAGLPYVIAGLVAAGGLAAALSTADGLLLVIANALSHDLYFKQINPKASTTLRLTIARILLVVVALAGAWVAQYRLAIIVELVAWAFSLAAASFFPALVMGIWYKKATRAGAIAGILVGLGVTVFYLLGSRFFGLDWFGIKTIGSGIFGLPAGFITIWIVSQFTKPPSKEVMELIDSVRYPKGALVGEEVHETLKGR